MPAIFESHQDGLLISTNKQLLDLDTIHRFLSEEAYWSPDIARKKVERAIKHSLCFGVYKLENDQLRQVGFARAVSDFATFAWLADVFILPEYQGHGLGKWLVKTILSHPDLRQLRRIMLATQDAHGLYKQAGFTSLESPENMLMLRPAALADHL